MNIFSVFNLFRANKQNRVLENGYKKPCVPIYGFYHIYCANNWKEIFNEQIQSLKESELYNITSKFFICVIGSDDDVDYVKEGINKANHILHTENALEYEFPTLQMMYEQSHQEDFYCYYFHTKGSSNSITTLKWYKTKKIKSLRQLRTNSKAWRRLMEYWNFNHWKLAIASLQFGCHAYGCILRQYSHETQYYGGNFWWSTSRHVKSRKPITDLLKKSRYNAEVWILSEGENYYNAFHVLPDPTAVRVREGIYQRKSIIDSVIASCLYIADYIFYSIRKRI